MARIVQGERSDVFFNLHRSQLHDHPFYSQRFDLATDSRLAAFAAPRLISTFSDCLPHVPTGPPCLMPISTPHQPSHPSFIKMEDRKRSAGDDLAPPTKRQAVNGKASADADMPWAADLEVCRRRRHDFISPFSSHWAPPIQSPSTCTGSQILTHHMSCGV